jgi:hypothetical protein
MIESGRTSHLGGTIPGQRDPDSSHYQEGKPLKRLVGLCRETEYSALLDKLLNEEQ